MFSLQKVFVLLVVLALTYVVKGADTIQDLNLCKSQYNGAILPRYNNCQKFYICINHKPYEYNCDPSFHFDPITRTCKVGANCEKDFNQPASCVDGTIRPMPDDCFIFEACVKGQFQKISCPPNYYFNAQQAICIPYKNDAEFKCNCLMPEHTVMENINNCETYYVCRSKNAILQNCPLDQYYNSQLNACITDLEGVCIMKPTMTPELEEDLNVSNLDKMAGNEVQTTCAKLGMEGIDFQTLPKECNTFYLCVNGQLYTQHCPEDFYYDSEKQYCILDSLKKCTKPNDIQTTLIMQQEIIETPKLFEQNKLFSKFIKF
ncbi:uncharacterized protein LOC124420115 [Lucilia cuprina]|uniref:uncharacterized protein LOC124420115 n=1 Tax=Lucilia cuprina TaxID=7375 RepID=UPI001F05E217|nr:uncharacterized protein LOC124420115 [Lucilia cuprina]